ncbi:ABC transporter substrate-binding protein [Rhizobium sp. AG855]|uniref:ABC transporter substrate-binding protein n=1 Tax=Rhizobium sp. AG855 TaxID=2183898 RepID=UPI000E72297D|nr:ABC transporter substrate-binding protein [Rhizobium sp. AG855]RKE83369.1 glycine betaine/proline transport system substrate-binding protein [Rhizobium sp. AG855]
MKNHRIKLTIAIAAALASSTGMALSQDAKFQGTVRIPVYNVPDSDFVDYTFGQVLQKAGYNVEYLKIDYTAHFTALEFGDVDLSPAVWGTSKDLIDKTVESGSVKNAGSAGVKTKETWWYPNYVGELCPGLPDWKALKDPACIKALSTSASGDQINYLGTPPDFAAYDDERIKALGLNVHITLPGTVGTMVATMQGAIQKKEPIIGWGMTPHWLYGSDQGKFVEFPEFDDRCPTDPSWGENPDAVWDCALSTGDIVKLYNVEFAEKAPDVLKIFDQFKLTSDDVAKGISRQDVDGVTPEQAAQEWIDANSGIWSSWLR